MGGAEGEARTLEHFQRGGRHSSKTFIKPHSAAKTHNLHRKTQTQKPRVKKNILGGPFDTFTKMIGKRRNGFSNRSENVLQKHLPEAVEIPGDRTGSRQAGSGPPPPPPPPPPPTRRHVVLIRAAGGQAARRTAAARCWQCCPGLGPPSCPDHCTQPGYEATIHSTSFTAISESVKTDFFKWHVFYHLIKW